MARSCVIGKDAVRLKFRPGIAYDALKEQGGKNRSAYLRNLIEKAPMPTDEYRSVYHKIIDIGRKLVRLGRIRDIDKIPRVLTTENRFDGFLDRATTIKNLTEMLALAEKLENFCRILPNVAPARVVAKKTTELLRVKGERKSSMCIRMPKASHDKMKAISVVRCLSMTAVLRAWILGLRLPDRSLQLAGAELIRASWLIKHIAGDWRRVMWDIPYIKDLVRKADALFRAGQRVANLTVRVVSSEARGRRQTEKLEDAK